MADADTKVLVQGLLETQRCAAGIEGELERIIRVLGPFAFVRGFQVREPLICGQHINGALEGQAQAGER